MANPYYQGPLSDHFDGERFFNPGVPAADKGLLDVLRWRLTSRAAKWPEQIPARSGVRPPPQVSGLSIVHVGHASLLLQVAGLNLLLDPVWSERVSPLRFVGPRRHNPPGIAFDDLPPIDAVLVSHNHYDHMDTATLERLWQRDQPLILSPLGNDAVIRASNAHIQVRTGDWWQSFDLGARVRATLVPSYHWSSRSLRDRRRALWGGFMLETPAGLLYYAGDTALRDAAIFHQIRERFGPVDVALLPIGAYAPRWFMRTQHTDPEEAARIAAICQAKQVLGIHWGTFQLTDEPFDQPEQKLRAAQPGAASQLLALHPGDTWTPEGGLNPAPSALTQTQSADQAQPADPFQSADQAQPAD